MCVFVRVCVCVGGGGGGGGRGGRTSDENREGSIGEHTREWDRSTGELRAGDPTLSRKSSWLAKPEK